MSAESLPTVIAIDGPAASGKGTIALRVAQALGFRYLDSGSLYRLVALRALERNVAADDAPGLAQIASTLAPEFDGGRIGLQGRGRQRSTAQRGGLGPGIPRRRARRRSASALLARQRAFRAPPGLVAEGRDMGTVVFPDAWLKVFLTASAEARASRRHKQLIEKGISAKMDDLLRDIRERDARDTTRAAAPLVPAADAVVLDSTDLSVAAVTDAVLALYRDRCGAGGCR